MDSKSKKNKALSLIETFCRKAHTLFSMLHSGVLVWQDGIDPRCMAYDERLRYLELQSVLNHKHDIVVYDIGANRGDFASFLTKLPTLEAVYCFEPIPDVFQELLYKTQTSKNIRCFQVALGDQCGMKRMYVNDFSPSSSMLPIDPIHIEEFPHTEKSHEVEVRMMTLEEAVREFRLLPPDFIKIDVQGFEDRVINGGREIIKRAKFCMLELSLVSLYEESVLLPEMNRLMRELGFSLTSIVGKIIGRSGEILQLDGLYRNKTI